MKSINSWFCFILTYIYLIAAIYTYITDGPVKDLIFFLFFGMIFYIADIQTGLIRQFKRDK